MDETKDGAANTVGIPVTIEHVRDWLTEGGDAIADTITYHQQRADAALAALAQSQDHVRDLEDAFRAAQTREATAKADLQAQRRYAEAVEKQLDRLLDRFIEAREARP